jgi:3-deoxy-D-manno-octulosonic acid (KDO) 8-phosphate synthase
VRNTHYLKLNIKKERLLSRNVVEEMKEVLKKQKNSTMIVVSRGVLYEYQ